MQKITFVNHTDYTTIIKPSQKKLILSVEEEDWVLLPLGHANIQLKAQLFWPFRIKETLPIKIDEDITTVGIFLDEYFGKYINTCILLFRILITTLIIYYTKISEKIESAAGIMLDIHNYLPHVIFLVCLSTFFFIWKASKRLKQLQSAFILILD